MYRKPRHEFWAGLECRWVKNQVDYTYHIGDTRKFYKAAYVSIRRQSRDGRFFLYAYL